LFFITFVHCPTKVGAHGRVGVRVLHLVLTLTAVDFVGGITDVSTEFTQPSLLLSNFWNMTWQDIDIFFRPTKWIHNLRLA
jgi:hypothetical protein